MPRALPFDEDFRAAHYLDRAEERGHCLCIGTGNYYPTWHKPGRGSERIAQLMLRVHIGKPKRGMVVLHSCDNKACINPDHLSWGTQSQNMKDALARGLNTAPPRHDQRQKVLAGRHNWARLTSGDIRQIRSRLANGERQCTIATDFGVGEKQISKIKLGQRWGYVT